MFIKSNAKETCTIPICLGVHLHETLSNLKCFATSVGRGEQVGVRSVGRTLPGPGKLRAVH